MTESSAFNESTQRGWTHARAWSTIQVFSELPWHHKEEVGSGLVEKDAASIDVNEDLRAAVTPPNVIHEPQGEKRRVMIMQEDDS